MGPGEVKPWGREGGKGRRQFSKDIGREKMIG